MKANWNVSVTEPARLAVDALLTHRVRAALAIAGIVIGIVTVVLMASILVNARNQIALLFRDLGTENVFAFHLTGDPYATARPEEVSRPPLRLEFVAEIKRLATSISDVGAQVIVPTTIDAVALVAKSGSSESDSVLVEGASPSLFEIIGAEFAEGRPFTALEDRDAAKVAVVGADLARALFGGQRAVGRTLQLAGDTYIVVGELAKRRGGLFGENRQDNVLSLPTGTVRKRFGEPERVILYMRSRPGQRAESLQQAEHILRLLRKLPPDAGNNFTLSTAEQIIATFDGIAAQIGLVTVGLAAVSLLIGGIGIANVMFISVTERTREIGVRLAVGARRQQVRTQFLIEAAVLSGIGGLGGVLIALAIGLLLRLLVSGFSAVPPGWAVIGAVVSAVAVGILAGYLPARRAAALDPVEALRYE